jgi:prepilin-type N-terminal cleavage/methylation domain-containing protein
VLSEPYARATWSRRSIVAELRRRFLDDQRGVTLVELLVVIVISAIIGSAILMSVVSAARAEQRALDLRENTDAARLATERIRDDLRGSFGVCDGSDASTLIVWDGDADGNERIEDTELRTFTLVDGDLRRADGTGAPATIVFGVGDGSSFAYFDRDGQPVAAPVAGTGLDCQSTAIVEGRGDIASVGVTLAGDRGPAGRTSPTVVDTTITLRNAAVADGTINPNRPPNAIFTHSCSGTQCTFNASSSYDEDGEIVQYSWDFGDGQLGTGVTVTHTYVAALNYLVTLTVVDDLAASDSLSQYIDATSPGGNATPSAAFTVGCSALLCSFDASASFDSDGTIVEYGWDFGDGNVLSGPGHKITTYTYGAPGTYPVTLTVTDNDGAFGTQIETANPTGNAAEIRIVSIENTSTRKQGNTWIPRVRITVQYPDGAEANAVRVQGRFGPENSTDLTSALTNSAGTVDLQANGQVNSSTYLFTVLKVDGHTIAAGSQTSLVLTRPN